MSSWSSTCMEFMKFTWTTVAAKQLNCKSHSYSVRTGFPQRLSIRKPQQRFTVLEHFQYLNFESKASAFEFYSALSRETDNTGLETPPVRFKYWAFFDNLTHSAGSIPAIPAN